MKKICELNDRMILGYDGTSARVPRMTARAIIRDHAGQYAVMYSGRFRIYTLPGGGVEDGEEVLTALHREIAEETGCTCSKIQELGIVAEDRGCLDYTQINHYFVVEVGDAPSGNHLTDLERKNQTSAEWHSYEKMVALIEGQKPETVQQKYLKARDLAALKAYQEWKVERKCCLNYRSASVK